MPKKPAQGIGFRDAITAMVTAAADTETQSKMREGETYHQAKQRIAQNIPEPPSTAPSWPAPNNPMMDAYMQAMSDIERANWDRLGRRMSTAMSTPAPPNPMADAYNEAKRRASGLAKEKTANEMADAMERPYTPPERLSPPANSRTLSRPWSRPAGWK